MPSIITPAETADWKLSK